MPDSLKKLRIFAASPSDVTNERAKLETVVDSLKPMADYLGLTLEVIDWRAVVPEAGRPQQVIFDQLKPTSWDIFIGVLWHRFGTPPGATDKTGKEYLSGTEEEFKTAYELWKQHGKPRMVLYRCTRALPFDVDPDQLKNVRAFFKLIEDVKGDYPTLYQAFDTTESFEKLVLNNLQKLLVEYGEESKRPITPEVEQVLAPKIPNNLPRRQAFFGRAKEMDIVMRALSPADRTWGVLVDGIGGIGKSAIAIEAAYRAQEAGLFEAFVFVTAKTNILDPSGIRELNPPARTLNEFLNETARVLGQPGIAKLTGDEKRRALIDVLRSMRTLLIYDNLETLSKEEQEGIADFLRELPQGCKAIITSRRRGGEGAVWLRVEKLDWNGMRGIIENEIPRDGSLANKLRRVESRWQELFDQTNGSPLALVHTLGLMRVRVALTFDGALEMLRGDRDEDLQKFIFQEARKELTIKDKAALGALSFFVSSTTFDAWAEVAELSRNVLEITINRLNALSLVDVLAGEDRYALHPLTRTFVRDELFTNVRITREMGMRFARYWMDYAKQYGGYYNYKTYEKLEAEIGNLEATANWLEKAVQAHSDSASDKDAAGLLKKLASELTTFLVFSGRWDESVQLNKQVYEAMRTLKDWSQASWHAYYVAYVYFTWGHADNARLWAEIATEASVRSKSKFHQAVAVRMGGLVSRQSKEYEKAEKLCQEALLFFENQMNDEWKGILFEDLGEIAYERKNYSSAKQYYDKAIELGKNAGSKELEVENTGHLGKVALALQLWMEARNWYKKALSLAQEVGHVNCIAQAQHGLARVYEVEAHADLALPLAQEALKIYERLQHRNLAQVRELVERLEKKIKVDG